MSRDRRREARDAKPSASVDESDIELFRQTVGKVRKVDDGGRIREQPKPEPNPRHTLESEARVLEELLDHEIDPATVETGEELSWLRPGLQSRILKRLKRGQFSVEGRLDLHNMNREAARISIVEFLEEAVRQGVGCVKIIHGKGLRSRSEGPVLKLLTDAMLRRHKNVMAYASARANDGGTGAVYVLLSRG
jgi:DNA-nicking Smr family endonuclease